MHVKFGDKNKTADLKLIKLQEKTRRIINFKNFNKNANPHFKENQIRKISDFVAYKKNVFFCQEITQKGKSFFI